MIAIAHILLGILIGAAFNNFLAIIILALISHFLLDALPHVDVGSFKRKEHFGGREFFIIFIDLLIGAALTIYFAFFSKFPWPNVLLGVFFAILPDILDNISWIFKWQRKPFFKQFHHVHDSLSFKITREMKWLGILVEIVVIVAIFAVLLFI